ncbi:hypothetical protein MIND_01037300 [Mycena indigotica]|uniref:WD40 repeat-like protein n=1 Tax=Mycena indigotica TaxID=2126181 RepID=A0A8H6VV37_9AGAR|nr:uncharacterized protein MIND_01037300 [Mycena indigotica]KAF7294992.1 hypothetical protein MIND_01037300 [Mycena indigotica]
MSSASLSVAIANATELVTVEATALRRTSSSIPTSITLLSRPTASTWANTTLFLASDNAIHQYNPANNTLTALIEHNGTNISHLLWKSPSTFVFAAGESIHVLESKQLTLKLDNKAEVRSLALSGGNELAACSASAVHLHDLASGKMTTLRGLVLDNQMITFCTFHPHTPAKLLLGIGRKLVVYDTIRASGPSKTIPINDSPTTEIIAISCSPFSKTLVAVATNGGSVGLVDLDKEKGLFRTLNLKVSITCMAFSPDGASLYIGTESGKLLLVDLRALDKPPKSVSIGSGARIETLAVQKKAETKSQAAAPTRGTPANTVSSLRGSASRGSVVSPPRKPAASSPRVPVKKSVTVESPKVSSRAPILKSSVTTASARLSGRKASTASSVSVGNRRPSSSASTSSSVPTVQTAGARAKTMLAASRTPTPELPSLHAPVTPMGNAKKGWAPESPERGEESSKAKGKSVNFQIRSETGKENERELSMQISPRRPSSVSNWAPSPLRNIVPSSPNGGGSTAQELLKGIVRDAMHDFQQEQRAEMVGMHLDVLKLGRELRTRFDDYLGELHMLREENQRLREENELLRRGY